MSTTTGSPSSAPLVASLTPPASAGAPAAATDADSSSERIGVLDVLRGIALLGMFVVHFTDASAEAEAGVNAAVRSAVVLLFESRFWAMFAILFGVGFAVQLARADARGERFAMRYVRRALALLGFGLVAEIGFGYHVLVEYAIWGLPLLLVRRWPTRRLLVLLVACLASMSAYSVARTAVGVARQGEGAWRATETARRSADSAFRARIELAKKSPRYGTVVRARLRRMPWWYTRWFSVLPVTDFPLFLIGMLGLRLGVFQRPREHRRLIVALMLFGVASWAAATWLLPRVASAASAGGGGGGAPALARTVAGQASWGFGLVRDMWLTFAYVGAVLLVVAHDRAAWLRRLAPFAWAGRMALTNYMLQVMVLDLTFSHYALGLVVPTVAAPAAALVLFAAESLASRWWLSRYRYGPLEWAWRSITYWERQPLLRPSSLRTPSRSTPAPSGSAA